MKNVLLTLSGWLVAAAFFVLAVMRAPAGGDAPSSRSAAHARPSAPPSASKAAAFGAKQQEESETDADVRGGCVQPGDDWEPPGTIESPEGIYAFLCSASPADRAIGERIIAARKAGDDASLLSAADDALRSSDPKVRAMAVTALTDMAKGQMKNLHWFLGGWYEEGGEVQRKEQFSPEVEKKRTALLLEFSKDDNRYVSQNASKAFFLAFSNMCDFDAAREIAERVYDGDAKGPAKISYDRGTFTARALGADSRELDPERLEKGMRAMYDLSSKNEDAKSSVAGCFSKLADSVYGKSDSEVKVEDQATLDRLIEDRKAQLNDLNARFPDDAAACLAFEEASQWIKRISSNRFKDADPERAQRWIAEQQTLLQKRLSERDRSRPIQLNGIFP